jgi:hypothetical protein
MAMKKLSERWHFIRRESFVRLVFYRGLFQFGFLAAAIFIFLAAIRRDPQFIEHAHRALVGFPVIGLLFGAVMWAINRLFYRDS